MPMKCLQQFGTDGHWGMACKLVTIPDPFRSRVIGATEPELQAALAGIRVGENLRRRAKATMQAHLHPNDEDPDSPNGNNPPRDPPTPAGHRIRWRQATGTSHAKLGRGTWEAGPSKGTPDPSGICKQMHGKGAPCQPGTTHS